MGLDTIRYAKEDLEILRKAELLRESGEIAGILPAICAICAAAEGSIFFHTSEVLAIHLGEIHGVR